VYLQNVQHKHPLHPSIADHHLLDNFYVVAMISNPLRWQRRQQLFKEWEGRMQKAGVKYLVANVEFANRSHKIMNKDDPHNFTLQTSDELWLKENALNLAVSRLPTDWQYVAWIDTDIVFERDDWALETVHQLQHYAVVQMFQTAVDLGPDGEVFSYYRSFAWCYVTNQPHPRPMRYLPYWHPGYAWACTREAWEGMGGLLDFAILGSGDHHMANALVGRAQYSFPKDIHANYRSRVLAWQENAEASIKRNVGYVPGTILHHWHGKKRDRKYRDRWEILIKNDFDPERHINYDRQRLLQLSATAPPQLRDDIRLYFRQRNEDSNDTEPQW
jgi:hypothetical protein